jgi:hypothetical protein
VRAKVVDNGDGSYECTWKGMVRGEYEVAVALKDDAIAGSPWKVVVRTGDAAAAKSTAEGSGLGGGFAGVPNSVLVEANDHYGNVVTNGGANVEAQLISVRGPTPPPPPPGRRAPRETGGHGADARVGRGTRAGRWTDQPGVRDQGRYGPTKLLTKLRVLLAWHPHSTAEGVRPRD